MVILTTSPMLTHPVTNSTTSVAAPPLPHKKFDRGASAHSLYDVYYPEVSQVFSDQFPIQSTDCNSYSLCITLTATSSIWSMWCQCQPTRSYWRTNTHTSLDTPNVARYESYGSPETWQPWNLYIPYHWSIAYRSDHPPPPMLPGVDIGDPC